MELEERSDAELIDQALIMWVNYIETGSVLTSANDVRSRNATVPERDRLPLRDLGEDQLKLISRLRRLSLQQRTKR